MKRALIVITFFFTIAAFGQAPALINYQAVAHDAGGALLTNQSIDVVFGIHEGGAGGPLVWEETHALTTNDYGLFYARIGAGTSTGAGTLSGFDQVPWGFDSYFLETQIDAGAGFENLGTVRFVSVPYAFYAENTGAINGKPVNSGAVVDGDILVFNGVTGEWEAQAPGSGGFTAGPGISIAAGVISNTGDLDPNDDHIISFALNAGSDSLVIVDGNGSHAVALSDINSAAGDDWGAQVALSDGSTIIGDGTAGNPLTGNYQAGSGISITGNTITNSGDPNGADDYNTAFDTLGGNLRITDAGGTLTVPISAVADGVDDADNDPTNELELPATAATGDVLMWNGTNWVSGPDQVVDGDDDATNELELPPTAATGDVLMWNGINWVPGPDQVVDGDDDATNELELPPTAATGDVLMWNGINWVPGPDQVVDGDDDATNELELPATAATGDVLMWNGTNWVSGPDQVVDGDDDATNELELPATAATGDVLMWNGTNWVSGPDQVVDGDSDATNELELPATAATGDVLMWNGTNWVAGIDQVNDADFDPVNEIQNISIAGNAINIDGGGTGFNLSPVVPNGGDLLQWNGVIGQWEAVAPTLPTPDGNGIYDGSGALTANTIVTQGPNTLNFSSTSVNGFSVGANALSVDAANGRVGIGTTAPTAVLDVDIIDPSLAALHITNSNVTSNLSAVVQVDVNSSSTNAFRIQRNGNIGIATASPTERLHIRGGSIRIDDGLNPYTLPVADGANGEVMMTDGAGNTSWQTPVLPAVISDIDGDTYINLEATPDEDNIKFSTRGIEHMTIDSLGFIGFGAAPSTGAHLIELNNTAATSFLLNNGYASPPGSRSDGIFAVSYGTSGGDNAGIVGRALLAAGVNMGVKGEGYDNSGAGTAIGVMGELDQFGNALNGYGVYARAETSGGVNNYGIYATASGGTTNNWAGYFDAGNVSVNGNMIVGSSGTPGDRLEVTNGSLLLNRAHLRTGGGATGFGSGSIGCAAPINSFGNDVAGFIDVAGCASPPGDYATVTFETPYAVPPIVVLTPTNPVTAQSNYFVQTSATGFTIILDSSPSPFVSHQWNYMVMEP